MKNTKTFVSFILIVLIIYLSAPGVNAAVDICTYSPDYKQYIFTDNTYIYAVSCKRQAVHLRKYDGKGASVSVQDFSINGRIIDCCFYNGSIYILCNEKDSQGIGQTKVYYGQNINSAMSCFIFDGIKATTKDHVAVDVRGNFYYSQGQMVYIYRPDGTMNKHDVGIEINHLVVNQSGELISAICCDSINIFGAYNSGGYDRHDVFFSTSTPIMISNTQIYFTSGKIYDISNFTATDAPKAHKSAVSAYNGTCIIGTKNALWRVNLSDLSLEKITDIDGSIITCGFVDKTITYFKLNNDVIYIDHFIFPDEEAGSDKTTDRANNFTADTVSGSPFSNVSYNVDNTNGLLSDVPSGTTVSTIKKELGNDVELISISDYKGNSKTSGILGTSAQITIAFGDKQYTYTVIIFGDVTGEGNVNSSDCKTLAGTLTGNNSISGAKNYAADVNHDSTIDTLDLLLMQKSIDGSYNIN